MFLLVGEDKRAARGGVDPNNHSPGSKWDINLGPLLAVVVRLLANTELAVVVASDDVKLLSVSSNSHGVRFSKGDLRKLFSTVNLDKSRGAGEVRESLLMAVLADRTHSPAVKFAGLGQGSSSVAASSNLSDGIVEGMELSHPSRLFGSANIVSLDSFGQEDVVRRFGNILVRGDFAAKASLIAWVANGVNGAGGGENHKGNVVSHNVGWRC